MSSSKIFAMGVNEKCAYQFTRKQSIRRNILTHSHNVFHTLSRNLRESFPAFASVARTLLNNHKLNATTEQKIRVFVVGISIVIFNAQVLFLLLLLLFYFLSLSIAFPLFASANVIDEMVCVCVYMHASTAANNVVIALRSSGKHINYVDTMPSMHRKS